MNFDKSVNFGKNLNFDKSVNFRKMGILRIKRRGKFKKTRLDVVTENRSD